MKDTCVLQTAGDFNRMANTVKNTIRINNPNHVFELKIILIISNSRYLLPINII